MNYRASFNTYLRRLGRSESTVKHHNRAVAEFWEFIGPKARQRGLLRHMVPAHLEEYKLHLLNERKLKPSTVNKRLSALSSFARLLVNKGLLSGNPLALVARAGSTIRSRDDFQLAFEKVQRLRNEVHRDIINVRDRAVVELLYAGLTVRELCSLKYDENWSADNNTIEVSQRRVVLHPRACLALEHYMILRPIIRGEFLFAGPGPGWSLKPAQIYWIIRRLARQTDVQVGVRDLCVAHYAAGVFGFEPIHISTSAAA